MNVFKFVLIYITLILIGITPIKVFLEASVTFKVLKVLITKSLRASVVGISTIKIGTPKRIPVWKER